MIGYFSGLTLYFLDDIQKTVMLGYCFSQTQFHQHAFNKFIVLTTQGKSRERIKFSRVLCGLACHVGLGESSFFMNNSLASSPFMLYN